MAILKSTLVNGDLTVTGSLNVQGDLTYVGVKNLRVKDHQIELNIDESGAAALAGADQAGIVIKGAQNTTVDPNSKEASILYNYGNDTLKVNKTIEGTVSNATTAASANKVAQKLTVNVTDETGSVKTVEFDGSEVKTVDVNLKGLQDQINSLTGGAGSIATQINNAINDLNVTDAAEDGKYVSSVSETAGKITVTRAALPDYSEVYDAKGAAAAAKTELIGKDNDTEGSDTIKGAKKYADSLADNYAKASHTHAITDVTGLQDALDGKAAAVHNHAIDNVTGLQTALDGKQNKLDGAQLAAVNSGVTADKVSGYDAHVADATKHITNTEREAWNAAQTNAKNYTDAEIKKLGSAARKDVLTGTIADSSSSDNLVTAAQVKAYADDASAAAVAKVVDGAPESFDTLKEVAAWIADNNHASTVAELVTDVNNLKKIDHNAYVAADEATLASAKGYADSLAKNYAAAKHSHAIADVTGLQAALDGKAAVNHNHDEVYSKLGHNHVIADITGLSGELAKKQNNLTDTQLAAVNSGITKAKVDNYEAHVADTNIHVSTADRTKWNTAEQNAKTYADGLAKNYDAAGSAATVKSEVIGTNGDAADKDTIYGAKKYADAAVKTLSDSVAATDAAQNNRLDTVEGDITSIRGNYVQKIGDTMTGDLIMPRSGNKGIIFGDMKIVWNSTDNAIEFIPATA